MSHGYISFGISSGQFATDGVINQAEAQAGLAITGYLQFFTTPLGSSTVQFNNSDIVDLAGTSLIVGFSANGTTINKTASLQADGSFTLNLVYADLQSFGDGSPQVGITADYTTAANYTVITGGDGVIGAANTTIQAAAANPSNIDASGGFVSLSSPGTKSTNGATSSSLGQLFRTSETSPSSVLPGFTIDLSPTVTDVAAVTVDGTYDLGDTIDLEVAFSESVVVSGTPELELETGSTNRTAIYISGSGSNKLTFRYMVQSGDRSADLAYASTTALGLAGGSIQDNAGNSALLALPTPGSAGSLDANQNLVVGSGPEVAQLSVNKEVAQFVGSPSIQRRFQFSLDSVNRGSEIGFFTVDDAEGRINGLLPEEGGYNALALAQGKVLFSALPGSLVQNFGVQRTVELSGGTFFRFFSVTDGTLDSLLTNQKGSFNFSSIGLTPTDDSSISILNLDGLQVTTLITDNPLPLGVKIQGNPQGEIIDLTGVSPDTVLKAVITTQREASFENLIGFYVVDDANGTVTDPLTGQSIAPGSSSYVQAILSQRLVDISLTAVNNSMSQTEVELRGGQRIAPFIVINDSIDALLNDNTNDDPALYTPFLGANSDGFDHFRLLGNSIFAIEDQAFGGDQDFNDAIIQVQFV